MPVVGQPLARSPRARRPRCTSPDPGRHGPPPPIRPRSATPVRPKPRTPRRPRKRRARPDDLRDQAMSARAFRVSPGCARSPRPPLAQVTQINRTGGRGEDHRARLQVLHAAHRGSRPDRAAARPRSGTRSHRRRRRTQRWSPGGPPARNRRPSTGGRALLAVVPVGAHRVRLARDPPQTLGRGASNESLRCFRLPLSSLGSRDDFGPTVLDACHGPILAVRDIRGLIGPRVGVDRARPHRSARSLCLVQSRRSTPPASLLPDRCRSSPLAAGAGTLGTWPGIAR